MIGHGTADGLYSVLYIHPIKQGLKRKKLYIHISQKGSSLHTSNKTRIETRGQNISN